MVPDRRQGQSGLDVADNGKGGIGQYWRIPDRQSAPRPLVARTVYLSGLATTRSSGHWRRYQQPLKTAAPEQDSRCSSGWVNMPPVLVKDDKSAAGHVSKPCIHVMEIARRRPHWCNSATRLAPVGDLAYSAARICLFPSNGALTILGSVSSPTARGVCGSISLPGCRRRSGNQWCYRQPMGLCACQCLPCCSIHSSYWGPLDCRQYSPDYQ